MPDNTEPTAPKSWRDVLQIHPAAELWPTMSPDELRVLGEDIKKNGMQVPISILHAGKHYMLLDGRNRLDAMEIVGLDVVALYEDAVTVWPKPKIPELRLVYVQAPNSGSHSLLASITADPYDYVVSVNEHRRHLTAAQRGEVAEKLLKARPDLSDRAIAKTAQVDHTTVATKRRKLEAGGEIHHRTKRTGRDGKVQAATKTKARASPDAVVLADPPALPEAEPSISESLAADPSASADTWSVEAQPRPLPDEVSLADWRQLDATAQTDLLARYSIWGAALRYIAERAPTIEDARRIATAALEGRDEYTATEKSVTEQPQSAAVEAKSEPDQPPKIATDRDILVAYAGGSATNIDKLVEIVSAAGDAGISRAALYQKHRIYGQDIDAAISAGVLTAEGNLVRTHAGAAP
ncbi:MAG TPA: ParB N-terminal domain-containing protein [Stellaceae bacterium]|nr:ParB N-terminal domain-containing protein [Stellaceae bacterium]